MSDIVSISASVDDVHVEDFVNLRVSAPSPSPPPTTTALDADACIPAALLAPTLAHTAPAAAAASSASSSTFSFVSALRNETLRRRVSGVQMSRHEAFATGTASAPVRADSDEVGAQMAATRSGDSSGSGNARLARRAAVGVLFVSNYRVRFESLHGGGHVWQLGVAAIANVEKIGGAGMQASVSWFSSAAALPDVPPALVVHARDARPPVRFDFADDDELERCVVFELLLSLAFPRSLRDAFALSAPGAPAAAVDDDHVYSYERDLAADLARMGISDAPCACHRHATVLDQSPPAAVAPSPSPSPPPPPAFTRFVQGLFAAETAVGEVVTVPAGVLPLPASDAGAAVAALSVDEALAEARRLFPRCAQCSGWRVTRVNERGAVCASYPDRLVVPAAIADVDVALAATHRSSQRFVVLGYRHAASGGAIVRASQPRCGLGGHRQRADELLVQAARRACSRADEPHDGPPLLIVDARPVANAMANMALGGGYESTLHYVHAELSFRGIANIHVVKSNLTRLTAACVDADTLPDCARVAQVAGPWLEQLRRVLDAAQHCAQHVSGGGAVLLHCSDGWDRTPQVLILARLLLDSGARTARGLCALLRTQWLALGHKSAERLGIGERGDSKEQSPVLLQTLECIWNIWQQHPTSFEFTPKLLALLLHYSTGVRFASFFGNSERERAALGVHERGGGACLWRYLLSGEAEREHGPWANPLYDSQANGVAPLRLALGGCDVQLWTAMHRRGLDDAAAPVLASAAAAWSELPLTFDAEPSLLQRVRSLVRSRDDF